MAHNFYNDCLGGFLLEKGPLHQSTCRDTSQQKEL